ncbi:11704_t:CDS:2 [Entrophospora sp. SA101]|nr:11704_t:CDS:2 [Entrophospora sp. SA101]
MRGSILVLGFITVFIIFLLKPSTCYVNANSLEAGSFQGSSPATTSNTKFRRRRYVVNSIEERADPNSPKPNPTVENENAIVATQSTNKKNVDQPEPISMVTIIALISAGGVVILMIIIFAFIRKRRLGKMANQANIITLDQQNNLYIEMKENEPQSYTTVATYTPNMSDELNIQLGDKVTILAEYDDGWVLGVNETRGGIKGVFPKNCGNESNNESIDTESDIDPDDYEYYDNHNRDIDFLIEDYIDLNNSLFNYEGSDKNKIDISVENLHHNENYEYNPNDLVSNVFAMMYRNCNENNNDEIQSSEKLVILIDVLKRKTGVSDKLFHHVLAIKATLGGINPSYLTS